MDFLPRVIRIVLKGLPHPVQRNATKAEYYFGGKIQGTVTLSQVQYSVFPAGEPGVFHAIRKRGVFAYLGNKPEQPPVADGLIAKRHKNGKGFSIGRKLAVLELAAVSPCYKAGAPLDGKELNLYPLRNRNGHLAAVSVVGKKPLLDGEIVSEVDIPHVLLCSEYHVPLNGGSPVRIPVP